MKNYIYIYHVILGLLGFVGVSFSLFSWLLSESPENKKLSIGFFVVAVCVFLIMILIGGHLWNLPK